MKKVWELESIGVLPNEGTVHDKFLDTIRLHDGRYEVSLPRKEQHSLCLITMHWQSRASLLF